MLLRKLVVTKNSMGRWRRVSTEMLDLKRGMGYDLHSPDHKGRLKTRYEKSRGLWTTTN